MNVQPGGLAIVINGLWPNVGRVVYVDRYVESWDFTELGLGRSPGWRVRTWSQGPLQTTEGPRLVGYTPAGSLRPLPGLPPDQARQVQREMALADFMEAKDQLAQILKAQELARKRCKPKPRRATQSPVVPGGPHGLKHSTGNRLWLPLQHRSDRLHER